MEKAVFEMIIEGANAEGKRIREAVEAAGKDSPIDARPGGSERYHLQVYYRDGSVDLSNSRGDGTPDWIWEGKGIQFELDPSVSLLALAALLEERPERIADITATDEDNPFAGLDELKCALAALGAFWVMEPEDWFASDMPTGTDTDEELEIMASSIGRDDVSSGSDVPLYPAFNEAEALDWLKERRDQAREELNEAA
jgi:hypothetical protein